ncbi:MFS transporter [Micromonospora sp. DR5-3]|uniref:MFS transporter n=1 Tax=unclassified Micromonospora TaxID=2617518 RepID=UPI0011DA40F7|nr:MULTISPECIES: MFS transporter [unclassified Micromonospora]MCW3820079.1 MFS transporter [Micromonospora sp. DR5-3]TYC19895.1 MFS transporter [Micromonospora sp. MP36]
MSRAMNGRSGWAVASIVACQLMLMVDGVIVTVALPHIRTDLGMGPVELAWVMSAYSVAFAGFLLVSGRVGTLVGPRRTLLIGVAVFILASAIGGIAPDGAVLITARALQGAGAALAAPGVLVLLFANTPDGPARLRAMGLVMIAASLGSAVGLIAGGLLTVTVGWRWVMLVNVPIGALVILGVRAFVTEATRSPVGLDLAGAGASSIAMVGLVIGLSTGGDGGWTSPAALAAFAAALVALAALVVVERRVTHPIVPGRLLSSVGRAVPYAGMLLMPAAMLGFFYTATLLYQDVLGYDALHTGLAFLPFTASVMIAGRLAPVLAVRLGERATTGLAAALAAAGVALFGLLAPHTPYWVGAVAMFILGFGPPMFFTLANTRILSSAGPADRGSAASLLQSLQQLGGAVGVATLTAVYAGTLADGPRTALSAAIFTAAAIALVLLAILAATRAFPRRSVPQPRAAPQPAASAGGTR